jgi:glycosyltransferase involved in cell wall biosynthesis
LWSGIKMKDKKITVLLPAYNEEKSVHSTINQIMEVMSSTKLEYEIIVVNDGSTDSTKDVLDRETGITLINNPYNLGYGASLKKGIKNAKYPWVLIVDADGTYPIGDIPKLIKFADDYDMVVGSRKGKNVNIPFLRRPAKWFISLLVNFMCDGKIDDVNSGFRIFKKEIAVNFIRLFPNGFSFTTTITLVAFNNSYSIKYVPIDYHKRVGKSTISPLKDFVGFISLIFKIVMYFNPLKFFLIPGILIIIAGIIHGAYQVLTDSLGVGQLPILLILGGLQICFLGGIADLLNKSTK